MFSVSRICTFRFIIPMLSTSWHNSGSAISLIPSSAWGMMWTPTPFSRFTRDPDAPGPGEELELARLTLRRLHELFPRVLVCESNHTMRPYKRALEAGLPRRLLPGVRQLLGAPAGWKGCRPYKPQAASASDRAAYPRRDGARCAARRRQSADTARVPSRC